jgi:xanthine dehydrogenase accessory factor
LAFFDRALIVVRGGGDLASGAIYRLHRAGFPVIVTELETPLFVRRSVSYGEAVYSGSIIVEGITARLAESVEAVQPVLDAGEIPVLIDPEGKIITHLHPSIIVDGRMAKVNLGTAIHDAPLVIGMGPGFTAGIDCHAAIETQRGHTLGRVIYDGSPEPDTGIPGAVKDQTNARVLRAPVEGYVQPLAAIGDRLEAGQAIAQMGQTAITAPFAGVLRGLIHQRVNVTPGMKIGDVDPRAQRENCFTISDKSLAIGGAALEALLSAPQIRPYLTKAAYETSTSL